MINRKVLLAGTACLLALSVATAALAQQRAFNIPPQDASAAIGQFGLQAGVQITAPSDQIRGIRTQAVRGDMDARAALQMLLKGTGLIIVRDDGRTIVLQNPSRVRAAPAGVAGTGESAVQGQGDADQKGGGAGASYVDEVVVTAQKKVENIQDVPASISVIGGRRLETLGATQLTDYAAYVPGLVVDSAGSPGQTMITLRGMSPLTSTAMVGTYIDDSPLGSSAGWLAASSFALDLMPYDIARVEVLRGPQGTLYGANTMGGLLKYVTNAPDLTQFSARAGSEISTINGAGDLGWGLRGGVNLPLVADKLAVSVTAFDQHTPGYIDNGLTGAKDENGAEQKGGRIALLWKPTDNLTVKLSAMGQDIDSKNNATVSLIPGTQTPIYGQLSSGHLVDQPFSSQMRYYTATINWDLGWADLTSASSYAKTNIQQVSDFTSTLGIYYPYVSEGVPASTGGVIVPPGLAPFELSPGLKKFTQEFRLSSPAGQRLEWLLGAFYTKEDAFMSERITGRDFSGGVIPGFDPFFLATLPTSYREVAAFANFTYKFTDAFDLSLGGRFARNEQSFRLDASGPFFVFIGADGTTVAASQEDVFTYSVAPRWHITDDTMAYARVASGYRPGGPNSPLPGVPPQVNSDRIVNYELGLKSEFLDRRAMIDVALFRVDWVDIQATGATSTGVQYIANGGRARSQGVELSAYYMPVRGLTFGFNTAYTDAKLLDPIPELGAASGDQLSYTPRWSGAVTADWEFPLSEAWTGQVGGGVRYVGDRVVGFPASSYSQLPSYAALDLHAGVSNDRWSLRLFVKNATDTRTYLTPVFLSAQQTDATVLQPRTLGVAFEAKF